MAPQIEDLYGKVNFTGKLSRDIECSNIVTYTKQLNFRLAQVESFCS